MSTNVTLQSAPALASALQPFCDGLCAQSRCAEWGIPHAEFEHILLTVGAKYLAEATHADDAAAFFKSLKVEELALARGCAAGHERAWEVFLTRYREKLFEMALGIAAKPRPPANSPIRSTPTSTASTPEASAYPSWPLTPDAARWRLAPHCAGPGIRKPLPQTAPHTSLDEEVEQGKQFAACRRKPQHLTQVWPTPKSILVLTSPSPRFWTP